MNDLETEEDFDVASNWYALQSSHMIDFIETTEQWVSSTKEKILNSLENRSDCSRRSGSSRRSKESSTSVASGRAKERAKAAYLMAKFAMLGVWHELEMKTDRLVLEEQLAVAHARERAYAEFEDAAFDEKPHGLPVHPPPTVCHSHSLSLFRAHILHLFLRHVTLMDKKSQLQRLILSSTHVFPNLKWDEITNLKWAKSRTLMEGFKKSLCTQQNKLTQLLLKQQQQTLLPALTITKFTGNPLDFYAFHRAFESQTESKLKSNDKRLHYLEQYLQGEPKELIKGCLHHDSQNGYTDTSD